MKTFFARTGTWLAAALITTILGSLFSSLRLLSSLKNMGAPVDGSASISMALYDLQHFGVLYGLFITIALLIAFLTAALVFKAIKSKRIIIYICAGAVAMAVMLWLMQQVFFGVPIVGGARDGLGLALQLFAGAVGGFAFAKLRPLKIAA